MQTKAVTIRVQTLDGQWETAGVDRLRGVWPENDSYTADEWGPSKCSFDLHRDPGSTFPDLTAWTPCEVEIGGVLIWSGRVVETPDQEAAQVFNVQGRGWQYHLDDDLYQYSYVHARVADYRDMRTWPTTDLTLYTTTPQVSVDRGLVVLSFPANSVNANGACAGVMLDLGSSVGRRIVATYDTMTVRGNIVVDLLAGDAPSLLGVQASDNFAVTATGRTLAATAGGSFRYAAIRLRSAAGSPFTDATDTLCRVTSIMVFADASYESGGASTLKAPTIVADALNRGTLLLSADRSGIDPNGVATFAFPEFSLAGQKTAREVWMAANAVQDWRSQIDVYRRPVFQPKPSAPGIEIGAWPGSEFDGASTNSGEEIYNRVIVEGTGADGLPVSIARHTGQLAGTVLEAISSPVADNPSFATNTATWTPSGTTGITRDTGTFDSSPASGVWSGPFGFQLAPGNTLSQTFTGIFTARRTYVLTMRMLPSVATAIVSARLGTATDSEASLVAFQTAAWTTVSVGWTPSQDTSGVTLTIAAQSVFATLNIDSLRVQLATPTLVDRRRFRRSQSLPIRNTLTPALGQQIGDVWLAAHKTTPLKGTVKVVGDRGVRDILTGTSVPPERLLLKTGELLRLSDRIDSDTGGQGRDGRIAEVTYTPATDTAVVALDNRRTSHEALLERLAVVVGTG